jgi:hypothetical protein
MHEINRHENSAMEPGAKTSCGIGKRARATITADDIVNKSQ